MVVSYIFAPTPFGEVMVAATEKGVCALFFADERADTLAELGRLLSGARFTENETPLIRRALEILATGGDERSLPLDLRGTPFQMEVWSALADIPRGETTTYGAVAARLGRPGACRAVGSAVGANPVSVIVPCHRVVRRGGALGGYRWGVERKKALLDYELEKTL
jgi:AraC family transcriptional regulator of adaptative response/methylated-DNA-[protein]-cysteine methyltransferase